VKVESLLSSLFIKEGWLFVEWGGAEKRGRGPFRSRLGRRYKVKTGNPRSKQLTRGVVFFRKVSSAGTPVDCVVLGWFCAVTFGRVKGAGEQDGLLYDDVAAGGVTWCLGVCGRGAVDGVS